MIGEQDHLGQMLSRLKLTAIRDQLDGLLDEAARRELTLRETVGLLCEREIARKDERRIEMALSIAKFPFVRDLAGFDFAAQPSLDPKQFRELATGRFVANGEAVLLLGPPDPTSWCPPRYHPIVPEHFAADRQTAAGADDEPQRFA